VPVVRITVAALFVWLAAAVPVRAQAAFVQGALGVDVRRFSAEETENVFDSESRAVAAGASGFFARHLSAGVEADFGSSASASRTVSVDISGRPTAITTTYTLRRRTVAALFGVHSGPGRRVRLGAYAGLAFSAVRREVSSDAPPVVLEEPSPPSVFLDRTVDAVVGVDAAFALVPRLAIVAGLRAQGLTLAGDTRGFSIRPAVGARVTF
jgi:hypothetical protein